ncbi:hypothetical protein CEXT_801791 [Caerostris extrusa]|uniref:Uncharacterized protein n=1 Tax=Caerostris extrusa TaxID=172846 RepID=A0AAV4R8P0_CAEEX|nr:hypothetical protein CEXT_801791 [Caerostris extrusa]
MNCQVSNSEVECRQEDSSDTFVATRLSVDTWHKNISTHQKSPAEKNKILEVIIIAKDGSGRPSVNLRVLGVARKPDRTPRAPGS